MPAIDALQKAVKDFSNSLNSFSSLHPKEMILHAHQQHVCETLTSILKISEEKRLTRQLILFFKKNGFVTDETFLDLRENKAHPLTQLFLLLLDFIINKNALDYIYYTDAPKTVDAIEDTSLSEKIYLLYTRQMLRKIQALSFTAPAGINEFLKEQWLFTRNNFLCITAHPDSFLTKTFIHLAEFCAKDEEKTAIEMLMPGMQTESSFDGFPHWGAYEDFKSGKMIIPTVNVEPFLKTHIISDDGEYPIPVAIARVYLEDELKEGASEDDMLLLKRPIKPYLSLAGDPENKMITVSELERLWKHSALTLEMQDAWKQYRRLSTNGSHLLGQLNLLCDQMSYNSAAGVGKEIDAGTGVYQAITNFMDYFQALPVSERWKIPSGVYSEIIRLLKLTTDAQLNYNATQTIETCIASRKSAMISQVRCHEGVLSTIGLCGAQKNTMVVTSKNQLQESVIRFKKAFQSDYAGRDALPLTYATLQSLEYTPSFHDYLDVEMLMGLSVSEIEAICENSDTRTKIVTAIKSIENLVIIVNEILPEKLLGFISALKNELFETLFLNLEDLGLFLFNFSDDQITVLCNALSLKDRIVDASSYLAVMKKLADQNSKKRLVIQSALSINLVKLANSPLAYNQMAYALKGTGIQLVISKSLEKITVSTADEYHIMGEHFDYAGRSALYNQFEKKLLEITYNAMDASKIASVMNSPWDDVYWSSLENGNKIVITTPDEFSAVLKGFPSEKVKEKIFHKFKDQVMRFSPGLFQLKAILEGLTTLKSAMITLYGMEKIIERISSAGYFLLIFPCLPADEQKTIFEKMKEKLISFCNTPQNINTVLKPLSTDYRKEIANAIYDRSVCNIKTFQDYKLFSEFLPFELSQRITQEKFEAIRIVILLDSASFAFVFPKLSDSQKDQLFNDYLQTRYESGTISRFYQLTNTYIDFSNIHGVLGNKDRQLTYYSLIKPRLRKLALDSPAALIMLSNCMFSENKNEFIELVYTAFKFLIDMPETLIQVLNNTSVDTKILVFKEMLPYFSFIIRNVSDVKQIFSICPPNIANALFDEIRSALYQLSDRIETAKEIFNFLPESIRADYLNLIAHKDYFKETDNLRWLLENTPTSSFTNTGIITGSLKVFSIPAQWKSIVEKMNEEKQKAIFTALIPKLLLEHNTSEKLTRLMQRFNQQECRELLAFYIETQIFSASTLKPYLKFINEGASELLAPLKLKTDDIVKSFSDLRVTYEWFGGANTFEDYLDECSETILKNALHTLDDLADFLNEISDAEKRANLFSNYIIYCADRLCSIKKYTLLVDILDSELQRSELFFRFNEPLALSTKSCMDFRQVVMALNFSDIDVFIEMVGKKLSSWVSSSEDVFNLIIRVSGQQLYRILKWISEKMDALFDEQNIESFLLRLPEEGQRAAILRFITAQSPVSTTKAGLFNIPPTCHKSCEAISESLSRPNTCAAY